MTRPVVFLGLIGSLLCSSCTSEDGVEKHTPEAVEKFEIREQKMTVAHLKDGAIIYGTLVEDGTGFLVLNTAKTGKVRIDKEHLESIAKKRFGVLKDSRDGLSYAWIEIAGIAWMSENLAHKTSGSWAPDNKDKYISEYGRLYAWHDAATACPENWRLPTDEEWQNLEIELGMEPFQAGEKGYRGKKEGDLLKPKTNSLFSLGYGGARYDNKDFRSTGRGGYYWSATPHLSDYYWARYIYDSKPQIARNYFNKIMGLSVRCVCELDKLE